MIDIAVPTTVIKMELIKDLRNVWSWITYLRAYRSIFFGIIFTISPAPDKLTAMTFKNGIRKNSISTIAMISAITWNVFSSLNLFITEGIFKIMIQRPKRNATEIIPSGINIMDNTR
jgi:hypothetical protein